MDQEGKVTPPFTGGILFDPLVMPLEHGSVRCLGPDPDPRKSDTDLPFKIQGCQILLQKHWGKLVK